MEHVNDIPGFEGRYVVSAYGVVYSLVSGKALKPFKSGSKTKSRNQHFAVTLCGANGVYEKHYVHRLVAIAFLAPSPGRNHVNHIDGDTANNAVTNLEWVTVAENNRHARALKLNNSRPKATWGDAHPCTRISDATVLEARNRRRAGERLVDLAREYGVKTPALCAAIKRRKVWA